ncbi:ANKRD50 [Mytilus coruscus]|uniref:ANKRD50 n=1 Tax=Mytilus coruscus TaxID=42192 RepID=A0A6J8CI64_MYTCO|nr:ANKRD50 [Mytilus coruscus]
MVAEWKASDGKVVKTTAIKYVKELVKKESIITVTGSSGSGKSTAIHHVALELALHSNYSIIPAHKPNDIVQYYHPDRKQVFVFDDVCGKYALDLQMLNEWSMLTEEITLILKSKMIKIITSCRSYIFQNPHLLNIQLLSSASCNMTSKELSLTTNERLLIGKIFLTEKEILAIKDTVQFTNYDFFPVLCKYYNNKKHGDIKQFFLNPNQFITDDLTHMMKAADQTPFVTLLVFVIYNNKLTETDFYQKKKLKHIIAEISENCDPKPNISIRALKTQIQSFSSSYVEQVGDVFSIMHDKIFDILASFYGNLMFDLILEMSHSQLIRDRYQFISLMEEEDECIIKVPCSKETMYFDRLFEDIKRNFSENVFANRQLQYHSFRKKFVEFIQQKKEIQAHIQALSGTERSPLLTMSDQGYEDVVEMLIDLNLSVNVCDRNRRTSLFLASRKGHIGVVDILLKNNGDPNFVDKDNSSPMYIASCHNQKDIVELLLKNRGDPCLFNKGGRTPLLVSAGEGHREIVYNLLNNRCDPSFRDIDGLTPLLVAVRWGQTEIVDLLLQFHFDPNVRGNDRNSPLHLALSGGYTDIAKLLLKHGSDSLSLNGLNETTLYTAAKNSEMTLKMLLENCTVTGTICTYSLLTALTRCEEHIVKLLLDYQCFPPLKERLPILGLVTLAPLVYSQLFFRRNENLVRLLMDYNFHSDICNWREVNISTISMWLEMKIENVSHNQSKIYDRILGNNVSSGTLFHGYSTSLSMIQGICIEFDNEREENQYKRVMFPFHEATRIGDFDTVSCFIEKKCNPYIYDINNKSVVYIAAEKGSVQLLELLLKTDYLPDPEDTSLCVASYKSHTTIVEILLKKSFNPNVLEDMETPLYTASKNGYTDIVKLLLKYNCNTECKSHMNVSSLYIASCMGHVEIVNLLLEHKSNPNSCNEYNESSLYAAVSYLGLRVLRDKQYIDIVELLLKFGCDPDHFNFDNKTPLYIATSKGNKEVVELLLKSGCSANICDKSFKSPLHIAASLGYTNIVKVLLNYKCNVNLRDVDGNSAFKIACYHGNLPVVKMLLLDNHCDAYNYSNTNESSLLLASRRGHTEIEKNCLGYKQMVDQCDIQNESPLFAASSRGYTDVVHLLLKHKSNPNLYNNKKETALYIASLNGHTDIVNLLLHCSSTVNLCNEENESPLYVAAGAGNINIVESLLANNSEIDMCSDRNVSPLYIATLKGHIKIVELLLQRKCNPDLCDTMKQSPLFVATFFGYKSIVQLLLKNNSNPNMFDQYLETPLLIAAKEGKRDIAKMLLDHGADPYICNTKNESPLYVAARGGRSNIVQLLLEYKCMEDMCYKNDISPRDTAKQNGHYEIVELLTKYRMHKKKRLR